MKYSEAVPLAYRVLSYLIPMYAALADAAHLEKELLTYLKIAVVKEVVVN